ncbi:MAG: ribonuclease P protein component [Halofilum sp. (in: g-proteobacteria)]|nr:ribonuclease P protein component [Halofilum sp. (in: g-proteobacteria)]
MASFPRSARLVRPDDFRRVFAQPIRFGDRYLTVLARPNDVGAARLGLAVSRRRIGSAVRRNLFKRIVRERFRHWRDRLGGHDLVVMPKPAAAEAPRAQLRASIDRQWGLLERRSAGGRDPRPGDPEQ